MEYGSPLLRMFMGNRIAISILIAIPLPVCAAMVIGRLHLFWNVTLPAKKIRNSDAVAKR